MKKISAMIRKMDEFYQGSHHDINHFMKVWTHAKTIGELEGLDGETQFILEAAAVTHDIACPLCREKYGAALGKYQELEGEPMVREFMKEFGLTQEENDRIAFLIAHHHTLTDIQGMDYQILIEADYLVNADEGSLEKDVIRAFRDRIFKTQTGIRLLNSEFAL